ncbi:flagellar motor protein MotB [Methylobacterium terrae]|uniref:Flagellar motor protein MotB n=1 Tax=Methylobacterium terrae TaxID=2202827 RepID=A0A2U8WN91_9HYPH|nr:OmpA family protein [Methylobacterium terrae]AWN47599.1 flagellar motor protein MotB [Methylobacterium terrae]
MATGSLRIDEAPARPAGPDGTAIRRSARRRLGRSCLALVVGLVVAVSGAARANPLTETPGMAERPEESGPAEAQVRNPSATAIIRSLAPFADGNPGAPARALSPDDGGPSIRIAPRTIDLTVFFAYDSARLTPEARIQLEPLGQALASRDLAGHGFLIAGHTDAAGAPAHNRRLSLARARAVRAHLVETYGIAPERLRVHGWGPSRPKDPAAPLSRVNRRVEVSLIAPARHGGLRFPGPAAEAACAASALTGPTLADPRRRVALDLDDFDAAPTPLPCSE